jgi:endo-1,4-beta-xylanase
MDYFSAMLNMGVPNIEMHIYGYGAHPGSETADGVRMSSGMTDRKGIPFGTWQERFIDWARDLGFLGAPGEVTRAATDIERFVNQPPPRRRGEGRGRGGRRGGQANNE